jgi:transketolase
MGDGEQQEGQIWEASQFAPHYKLDNLIAIVDWNNQQIDGPTDKVMNNLDIKAKYEAFGWATIDLQDGNNMQQVVDALTKARLLHGQGKPIVILQHPMMSNLQKRSSNYLKP